MKIYDLTRTISDRTEVYAGDPPPLHFNIMSLPGDMCNLSGIKLCLHTGTHADAPLHFIENGLSVEMLPPEHFAGRAYTARIETSGGVIKTGDIKKAMTRLEGEKLLVLFTGHESFENIPVFESEIGALLSSYGVITLASDLPSMEPAEKMHRDLFGHGIVIIEALTGLGSLPEDRFFLYAAPLKIKDGDGSPLRALAVFG